MTIRRRHRALFIALPIALGCGDAPTGVETPANAVRFTPEPIFRDWWAQVERCAGRRASYEAVTWMMVPGDEPFRVRGLPKPVLAYWDPGRNWIVMLEYTPDRAAVARHEALHAILRRTDHPREYFETRCGDVIASPGTVD